MRSPGARFPIATGDWARAAGAATEAVALTAGTGHTGLTALPTAELAGLAALRGDAAADRLPAGATAIREAQPVGLADVIVVDPVRWARGLRARQPAAALHRLGQISSPVYRRTAALDPLESAVRAGREDLARRWLDELEDSDLGSNSGPPVVLPPSRRLQDSGPVTPATREVGSPRPRHAEEPEVSTSSCPAGPRTRRPTRRWSGERGRSLLCTTADRSLIARLAAHESWASTTDPSARTEPARRAGYARKASSTRLALRSAQARRKTPGVADENGRRKRPDEDRPQQPGTARADSAGFRQDAPQPVRMRLTRRPSSQRASCPFACRRMVAGRASCPA